MGKIEELRNKKWYKIYRMWHESTPGVRYVGLTVMPLIERLIRHIDSCSNRKGSGRSGYNGIKNYYYPLGDKQKWIISLLEKGLCPHIDELETLYGTFAEARAIEDDWMMHYLSDPQYTLLNAKLPKEAQAIVKGLQLPESDLTDYEEDQKQKIMDACRKWTSGGCDFNRFVDEIHSIAYILPKYQLSSPVSSKPNNSDYQQAKKCYPG